MTLARPTPGSAWFVILGGVSAALHVAKLSPAIPALQRDLGVSLVTSGLLLSLVLLASALTGLFVGLLVERFGLRRSHLVGLGVLSAAGFAGGFAPDEAVLLVLRAVEGIGFLLATVPAPALVRRLVTPHRLTRMLGFWSAFIPVGAAGALLVGASVIDVWRWPGWWWLTATASAVAALLVRWRVPADPAHRGSADGVALSVGNRARQTLVHPAPWLLALTFACYSLQWLAVIGFLPSVYAASGWGPATVAVLAALVALANVVGNVGAGFALHHGVGPRTTLLAGFTAMALGAVLAFASPTSGLPLVQYSGALLFSAFGGLVPGTLFAIAPRLAPSERTISTTVGWMMQWSALGQLAGPPLVASLATLVGGWQLTWLATGSASVVGILLAVLVTAHATRRAAH